MNDTPVYDWTKDDEFARVLLQTGEHSGGLPPDMTPAVYRMPLPPALEDAARRAPVPGLSTVSRPDAAEVRTADGRTLYAHLAPAPAPVAPAPAGVPVSRWAVNTALVSLSLSGAAWVSALALGEFAQAAVALAAALTSLGKLALVAAVVFGLIVLVRKKTATVIDNRTVTTHVTASGLFARAFHGRTSADTTAGGRS